MLRLIFVLLLSSAVSLAENEDTVKPASAALQYTQDTFSENLLTNNQFVMFFAPWCGHCHRLAPIWEELAVKNNVDDSDVTIAKVDCTTDTSLCSDNDVTGYPTLKFFKLGETEGVKYRGPRELDLLSAYVDEQLGKTKHVLETPEVPKPVSGLFELTDDTFAKHVETGKHFVKFYAPWCGHCQKLAPTWDTLARSLEHSTAVTIAKVDCTVHRAVCSEFEIKGYPSLLWIEDGKKVEKYQGQRSLDDMKEYVSRMTAGPADSETAGDEAEAEAGPVVILTGENFEHGIATGFSFVKFYAPWCGHCKRLGPIWEELGKKFIGNSEVKIVKVDCTLDSSKDLCNQQEVDGFPTMFLYRDGKKVSEYHRSRSLEDLIEFVSQNFLPHDEL